jgi:hypothetical protein
MTKQEVWERLNALEPVEIAARDYYEANGQDFPILENARKGIYLPNFKIGTRKIILLIQCTEKNQYTESRY